MVEFGEVKFEPAILRSKTSLKPAARPLEGHPADIARRDDSARKWKILRASAEGVSLLGPLVQSFGPRPLRSLRTGAKRPVRESELHARK